MRTLAKIEEWSQVTRTGDLAELPGLDERSPLIPLVTSTRENCLGAQCPKFRSCHVNQARREALAADVVVINHHLFFADLAVRESGMAELLPTVRVAIFDEAHQLNETGVQFLGAHLATGQLLDFARDMLAAGLQLARGLVDWQQVAAASSVQRATCGWWSARTRPARGCAGSMRRPAQVSPHDWRQGWMTCIWPVRRPSAALATVSEIAPDFVRLHERAEELAARVQRFARTLRAGCRALGGRGHAAAAGRVAAGHRRRPCRTSCCKHRPGRPRPRRAAWIFTSATLGDDARLSWFTEPCGLAQSRGAARRQPVRLCNAGGRCTCRAICPSPTIRPIAPRWRRLQPKAARRLGGRTMVLTTTLRALARYRRGAAAHNSRASGEVEVLVQGQWPKRRLIERFREGSCRGRPGCVLVASASFWEGVDVPGDALQLVVIDKLPFPPPGDPLVEARAQRLESQGRSAFNDYFVPEAAVALKQGAGRLIRRESDQGVLVVCDTRLATMGYGRRLLAALPPMRRLRIEARVRLRGRRCDSAGCSRLPDTSTTDPAWS